MTNNFAFPPFNLLKITKNNYAIKTERAVIKHQAGGLILVLYCHIILCVAITMF